MHQHRVVKARELVARLGVADHLRFARQVARGHHQRPRDRVEQQVVQGRVGQHPAERRLAGRKRLGQGPARLHQQDDRCPRFTQQAPFLGAHPRMGRDHLVGAHQRERLCRAALAVPEPRHGTGIGRVTGEVEAAEPLDRDDLAAPQRLRGQLDGIARRFGALAFQPDPRPAGRTGDRLGMEPPVGRVGVFGPAIGAHLERRHRGLGPVVGQPLDDREARAAMGTIGERIPEAARRRIADLGEAGGTGRGIGSDPGFGPGGPAGGDLEARRQFFGRPGRRLHRIDPRQRRRFPGQRRLKPVERRGRPGRVDQHALGVVQHPAPQPLAPRNCPDEGPEAHALHLTPYPYPPRLVHGATLAAAPARA